MILAMMVLSGVFAGLVMQTAAPQPAPAFLHVCNTFEFNLRQSQEAVAPLFGAHLERVWAEGWDPQFVYPQPAEDRQGAVFLVKKGSHDSTWINTIFEPQHIQYVYFIPQVMAVLIDITLSPAADSGTHVNVRYERTALSAEMNDHVRHLGAQDAKSADEWRTAIEKFFEQEEKKRGLVHR
jgi:hypothetical protein